MTDKKRVLGRFNSVDDIIAGTMIKIIKGFVIPPVKKTKTDS